ncbi:hypothetical protein ZWY2020_045466 [Hordeum vulgare]|nr:hypothetical protein ZWY2020_045466 [Hordeum vulgare]
MPGEVGKNADLFRQFMALDKELSMLECEEEDLRVEIANLLSVVRLMEAVHDYHYETKCGGALIVGRVVEVVDEGRHAVVTTGVRPFAFCVPVLGDVDNALLKPSANVALSRSNLAVVQVVPADSGWTVPLVKATERPSVTYADVVGCDEQKRELLEAVELPLTHPELFSRRAPARPPGHRQDHAGQSRRASHLGGLHPRERLGVREHAPGRGAQDGARGVPGRPGERAGHHLLRRGGRHRGGPD